MSPLPLPRQWPHKHRSQFLTRSISPSSQSLTVTFTASAHVDLRFVVVLRILLMLLPATAPSRQATMEMLLSNLLSLKLVFSSLPPWKLSILRVWPILALLFSALHSKPQRSSLLLKPSNSSGLSITMEVLPVTEMVSNLCSSPVLKCLGRFNYLLVTLLASSISRFARKSS